MKIKHLPLLFFAVFTLVFSACHARKAAGTKQQLNQDVAVPAGNLGKPDTSTHTPTPNITPQQAISNVRPKPVPQPQPPVPPM